MPATTCPRCSVALRVQAGPFGDTDAESLFGVAGICPRCGASPVLTVYPIGPLVPAPAGCLNCGDARPLPPSGGCPSCGFSTLMLDAALARLHDTGLVEAARARLETGEFHAALLCLNQALRTAPDDVEAWLLKDRFLESLGFCTSRLAMLEQAQALVPGVGLRLHYANALAAAGRHADAIAAYQDFLARQPAGEEAGGAYLNLANSLRAVDRAAEAEAGYRDALRLLPESAAVRFNYARFLLAAGRAQEALAMCEEGLRCPPDQPYTDDLLEDRAEYRSLAVAAATLAPEAIARGEPRTKEAAAREAIAREPREASHYLALARALNCQDRRAEAHKALDRGIREATRDGYFTHLQEEQAFLFAEGGAARKSLAAAEEALRSDPGRARAQYLRARALGLLGRLEEARDQLQALLAKRPTHDEARRALGLILGALAARKPWWKFW